MLEAVCKIAKYGCGATKEDYVLHFLQTCPLFEEAWQQTWGEDTPINEKLRGKAGDLRQTVQFIDHIRLTI